MSANRTYPGAAPRGQRAPGAGGERAAANASAGGKPGSSPSVPPKEALFPGVHIGLAAGELSPAGAILATRIEFSPVSGGGTITGATRGKSNQWTLQPEGTSTITDVQVNSAGGAT